MGDYDTDNSACTFWGKICSADFTTELYTQTCKSCTGSEIMHISLMTASHNGSSLLLHAASAKARMAELLLKTHEG